MIKDFRGQGVVATIRGFILFFSRIPQIPEIICVTSFVGFSSELYQTAAALQLYFLQFVPSSPCFFFLFCFLTRMRFRAFHWCFLRVGEGKKKHTCTYKPTGIPCISRQSVLRCCVAYERRQTLCLCKWDFKQPTYHYYHEGKVFARVNGKMGQNGWKLSPEIDHFFFLEGFPSLEPCTIFVSAQILGESRRGRGRW